MLHRVYIVPLALALLIAGSAGSVALDRDLQALTPVVTDRAARVVAAPVAPPTPEPDPTPVPATPAPVATAAPRAPGPVRAPLPPAFPVRGSIRIPSLGTDGPVVATRLDERQDMVIPRNSRDVAWLDYGSYPGPFRNVVLAGHRSWGGRQGTFWKLDQVSPGAEVLVDVDGVVHTYVVRWVRLYDPDDAPVEELLGQTDVHSVTLITCGGRFDRARRGYEMRVVVRAEIAGAQAGAG